MKSSSCQWYLEPLSASTNRSVADILSSDVSASEQSGMKCADGRLHDLWSVNFGVIEKAIKSLKLKDFHVWRSENGRPPEKITKTVKKFFGAKTRKPKRRST